MTTDDASLQCLHLAFPETLLEEIVDLCHAVPDIPGFSIFSGVGIGSAVKLRSTREVVLGRAAVKILVVVAPADRLRALLAALAQALPTPDVAYWITPVESFGRLA